MQFNPQTPTFVAVFRRMLSNAGAVGIGPMMSALRVIAQQQDAVTKEDRTAPSAHIEMWDPPRLHASGSSIAVLAAAQSPPGGNLLER